MRRGMRSGEVGGKEETWREDREGGMRRWDKVSSRSGGEERGRGVEDEKGSIT